MNVMNTILSNSCTQFKMLLQKTTTLSTLEKLHACKRILNLHHKKWYTMIEKSLKTLLNTEKDLLITPNSIFPAKYRGATTAAGKSWMR